MIQCVDSVASLYPLAVKEDARSDGEICWMDVSEYLKRAQQPVKQIAFAGEHFDVMSVRRWRDRALRSGETS